MAHTEKNTDLGDDILLDEQSLGDLSLDDGLFDDLDSEIKLDEPGEGLELNLDDLDGAPPKTDDADLDLSLDDLDLSPAVESVGDDLDLSLDDLDASPGGKSVGDDLDLSLDDLDKAPASAAADDELELPPLDDGLDDLTGSGGGSDELDVSGGASFGDGLDDLLVDESAGGELRADDQDAELDLGEEELETEIDLDLDEGVASAPEPESDEGELALSEDIELETGDEGLGLETDELDLSLDHAGEPEEEVAGFQAAADVDLDELDLSEEMSALAEPVDDVGHEQLDAEEAPAAGAAFDIPFDAGAEEHFEAIEDIDLEESPVLELDVDDEIELAEEEESMMPSAIPQGDALGTATMTAERQSYELPTEPAQAAVAPARGVVQRDVLLSIPHRVSVEVGSVTLDGKEILQLGYGSVVQLERSVGDPVDLVLEGRSIAKGEIVLINGKHLGVRIVSMSKA